MAYIELNNITKKYPKSEYLSVDDFNLHIEKGEFIVFVGPSGCGKSTTLRMVAGLEDITSGEMKIEGEVVNDVSATDRNISMVFQSYALYPHMKVDENIKFSMKMKKIDEETQEKKANWSGKILQLSNHMRNLPKDLSGGQRQRVALARAIVRDPKLFLMDEPLSNLDAKLRGETRSEILKLHKDLDATIIYVTHDQVEAMTMGDRIVVMNKGVIQQVGKPLDLYRKPANIFVATFLGLPAMNIIDASLVENKLIVANQEYDLTEGVLKSLKGYAGDVKLGIRPEDFRLSSIELQTYENSHIKVKIEKLDYMGNEIHLFSNFNGTEITIKAPANNIYKIGEEIELAVNPARLHFFDPVSEERIND